MISDFPVTILIISINFWWLFFYIIYYHDFHVFLQFYSFAFTFMHLADYYLHYFSVTFYISIDFHDFLILVTFYDSINLISMTFQWLCYFNDFLWLLNILWFLFPWHMISITFHIFKKIPFLGFCPKYFQVILKPGMPVTKTSSDISCFACTGVLLIAAQHIKDSMLSSTGERRRVSCGFSQQAS